MIVSQSFRALRVEVRAISRATQVGFAILAFVSATIALLTLVAPSEWRHINARTIHQAAARELHAAEDMEWQQYWVLARIMHTAASWPGDRDLTKMEWQSVLRVALALQRTDPSIIEKALLVYVVTETWCPPRPTEDVVESWTKPILLLRVMFDIPEDAWRADDVVPDLYLAPCGGLPYEPADKVASLTPHLSLPVKWSEQGPVLLARRRHVEAIFGHGYQAHLEFRAMLSRFPYRQGLERYVNEEVNDWRSLIHLVEPMRFAPPDR
jgi:hypothetical protein